MEDNASFGEAIAYLTKYMEKSGEKIVYSKGLPQFFISDVMENDVVCPIGQEDKSSFFLTTSNVGTKGNSSAT